MNNYINIEQKVIEKLVHKIAIKVLYLELNKNAIIKVESFSENNELLDTNNIFLDGADYQNWNNDDFLIQYVCNKFGFTLLAR
jgi:hypothetical protein